MSRNKDKKDTAENQDFILSYLECLWLNVLSEPEVRQKKKKKKDTDTDQQIGGFNQLYSMEQNSLKWAVTDKWFT